MHIEKIHFDDVFDVVHNLGTFSFRTGQIKKYEVTIAPHMVPRPGTTYVVAFTKPKDWRTIVGWRILGSEEVVLAYSGLGYWISNWINSLIFIPFTIYRIRRINRAAQHALAVVDTS
jgi:hypothetical protein